MKMPHHQKRMVRLLSLRLLHLAASEIAARELTRSALVFSPHPDDESLACGGTIIKKRRAGASVKVVHMTDGSASTTLIPREELAAIRKRESLNAARVLGVNGTYFLDFPDSKLSKHLSPATDRVVEIFEQESPEEVFMPHAREPARQAADHLAATMIVQAALQRYQRRVTIWEYPVWYWLHWPWVRFAQKGPPIKTRHILRNSLESLFGARDFIELTSSVHIGDVLAQKRAALAQHRSQMEQFVPDARWVTLAQLSKGDFLECFDQDREFFHRYEYRRSGGTTRSRF